MTDRPYSLEEWRRKVLLQFPAKSLDEAIKEEREAWDLDWRAAWEALFLKVDQAPLSEMFGRAMEPSAFPVPPWVFEYLEKMLSPQTKTGNADRLVYQRSKALKGKVKTNEEHIAVGVALADLIAEGMERQTAIDTVIKNLKAAKATRDQSHIEKHIVKGTNLPEFWKEYARKSDIYQKAIGIARNSI